MSPVTPQHNSAALVIDDSPVQRAHAVQMLRDCGCTEVLEAEQGAAALELLASRPQGLKLIMLDLEMDGMNGISFLEHLPRCDTPIVLCSSREQRLIDSVQTLGLDLGLNVVAALRKPLNAAKLARALCAIDAREPHRPRAPCAGARPEVDKARLAAALAEGRLEVHYQPKVRLDNGGVCGAEALARWNDPVLGPIAPDQFVPLAEREDLAEALTRHVLQTSLQAAATWRRAGHDLSVAVNLSPQILDDGAWVRSIPALARQHGIPAERVILEITEGALARHQSKALANLAQLRLLGFGLSIDDYGTGYSSLQQLARLPFSELKIDRSFILGAASRPRQQAILTSALDLARRLSLVTVAEGVENPMDWDLLYRLGCRQAQGWLIARAMPLQALLDWLRQGHPTAPPRPTAKVAATRGS